MNVTHQLCNDFNNCACLSLQLADSTDINDHAKIIFFVRMVFQDWTTKEELLGVISFKEERKAKICTMRLKTNALK